MFAGGLGKREAARRFIRKIGCRLYCISAVVASLIGLAGANLDAGDVQALEGMGQSLIAQARGQAEAASLREPPIEVHNDYYVINGEGFAHFRSYTPERDEAYVAALNNFADLLPEDVKLYSLLAPTSAAWREEQPFRRLFPNQQELIRSVWQRLDSRFTSIDIWPTLAEHRDEYLYFRTDHHWTAQAGYLAYRQAALAMGLSPVGLENYHLRDAGVDYLGSIYGATGSSSLIPNADRIYYYQLPYVVKYTYWDNQGRPHESKGLYKAWWLDQPNKYAFFMGGDLPYIKLEMPEGFGNGRRLALIKDSYANTIIPFLTAHYQEIYVIDPRNSAFNAVDIIRDNQVDEVLFVNYARVLCLPEFSQALQDLASREPVAIQPVP